MRTHEKLMHFYVDPPRRFAVGWSPKCGCTHVKAILLFCRFGTIDHNPHASEHRAMFRAQLPAREELHAWTVLVVVRSPYERVVSGFLDKYEPSGELRHLWPRDHLTFGQFVNALARDGTLTPAIDTHHFEPQMTEPLAGALDRAQRCVVCDIGAIDYALLEATYEVTIPPELLQFRGSHARTQAPGTWDRAIEAGSLAVVDVRDFEAREVRSIDLVRPRLARLIATFYAIDLAFCASRGLVYAPPFAEQASTVPERERAF